MHMITFDIEVLSRVGNWTVAGVGWRFLIFPYLGICGGRARHDLVGRMKETCMDGCMHGNMEAWKHGNMEAWKHGSMTGWLGGIGKCSSIQLSDGF
ncbi:hypothetical protein EYC84_010869 [Monilinia fructicola]|uniref:Uncharacterized protein n=1 Tax=Monilinia fructicola TaxID=38448 RepID=A0A5M9J994_MONFR|nr:hypothetical protein EYC84_010869 [Monilinia fructicola]